jgi:hypothetical protein
METLFGTLCLRREANPAKMLQCRLLVDFVDLVGDGSGLNVCS